jgi:general L-amino acid transport system permease protein
MVIPSSPTPRRQSFALLDARVLAIIGQVIFAIVLIAALYALVTAIFSALGARNLTPNTNFFGDRAGFDIGDKPVWYTSNSTYWEAYVVGFINTMRVVVVGLVLATVLGVFGGIFLLSSNWLLRTITLAIVELLRNTPLLVQLFVWYFAIMLSLPSFQQSASIPQEGIAVIPVRYLLYALAVLYVIWSVRGLTTHQQQQRRVRVWGVIALLVLIEVGVQTDILGAGQALRLELRPWVFINIRGFAFPEVIFTARLAEWLAFVGVGVGLALVIWVYYGRQRELTGIRYPRARYGLLAIIGAGVIGWVVVSAEPPPNVPVVQNGAVAIVPFDRARADGLLSPADEALYTPQPLIVRLPDKNNFRYTAGAQVLPEYMALLLGLSIYTAAFIAEIVRAGILAVPKGQVEAARALGLSSSDVLSRVILPQALRVIIPPLGNQYLNLAKNSSLAIAIAYADLFQVTTTIMNQSGQSVTGMAMVMVTYLIISLTIATLMNRVNRRFQIVTR